MSKNPTVWEPIPEPQNYPKPGNPKLRMVAIIIGLVLMLGFVIYVTFLPRQYEVMVSIDSKPQGAKLFINEQERGVTPMRLALEPDSYSLKLELGGYNTLTTNIDVIKDNENYSFDLTNRDNAVSITTIPDGADVYIDGVHVGKSNLKYKRDLENIHKVKAVLPGFTAQERIVDFSRERDIIFNLEKSFFSISVISEPEGAVLYIDEDYKGQTPLKVELPEGDHDFRLVLSGRKSILRKMKVQTSLELKFSFEESGFTFDTMLGEENVPGSSIYLFHMAGGVINTKIPPLFVGKTPVSKSINDIMTYITMDLKTKTGLIIANHPTLGSSATHFDIEQASGSSFQKFTLQLSGASPMYAFGQPIDKLDYNNLSSEKNPPFQDALSNKRFILKTVNDGVVIIDRDNYPIGGKIMLEAQPEKLVLSPDQNHMIAVSGKKGILFEIDKGKMLGSFEGSNAYFSLDGKHAVIYSSSFIRHIAMDTLETSTVSARINGTLVPVEKDIALEQDNGKVTGFVNIRDGKRYTWNELFTENPFEPKNIIIKNIAGTDSILLCGKLYGLDVIIKMDGNPVLLYVWIPDNVVDKPHFPNL
jgi:hypothetical protein